MEAVVLGNFRYAVGPTTGLVALLVLLLASRFIFGTGRRRELRADFGLLVEVAGLPTRAAAERARGRLAGVGIRATISEHSAPPGPVRISADGRELPPGPAVVTAHLLVFPVDAERARQLLSGPG